MMVMDTSYEIVLAGFGGQGILSMGQIIAYAAMLEGKDVSWMPSYGPEMRGGTANCVVIVSDKKISSPIISNFDIGVVFNQPSLDKFESTIKSGGILLYEISGIVNPPQRSDIEIIGVPALKEAANLNKKQVANMVMLGALLEASPVVKIENIILTLKKVLPERHHHLIELNEQALLVGKKISEQKEQINL
jgi:2-oxoglutarate ferredoxin oxidoreductase subunit gamma